MGSLLLLSLAPTAARADAPAAAAGEGAAAALSLRRCLELAERNHPNILSARARVDHMRAQLEEARSAPFSNFSLTAGAGPAPTFRGGQVYTQDREVGLSSSLGMAWRVNVDGTVPLWTFGKITSLWRAAEAQIEVGEGEVQKAKNVVRLDVRKAYYGVQLSRDALALLGEASERLEKAVKGAEKKVKEEDGDEIDLIKLQMAQAELEARLSEAKKSERIALAALRFYTGVTGALDVPNEGMKPPKRDPGELEEHQAAARQHRPELRMAKAGLTARTAQLDLARAKLLPDVGLSLFGSYSRAPEITDQLNPFVRDDANFLRYGFGVGVRWSLDFLPASARIKQAEAQLSEMRQTHRLATGGVGVEVEKAYAEAIEAKKKAEAFQRASKLAKQWMIKVTQGIDVGVYEERDLVDPARQYAQQRYSYLSALMDYNLAMANLALVTGRDSVADQAD